MEAITFLSKWVLIIALITFGVAFIAYLALRMRAKKRIVAIAETRRVVQLPSSTRVESIAQRPDLPSVTTPAEPIPIVTQPPTPETIIIPSGPNRIPPEQTETRTNRGGYVTPKIPEDNEMRPSDFLRHFTNTNVPSAPNEKPKPVAPFTFEPDAAESDLVKDLFSDEKMNFTTEPTAPLLAELTGIPNEEVLPPDTQLSYAQSVFLKSFQNYANNAEKEDKTQLPEAPYSSLKPRLFQIAKPKPNSENGNNRHESEENSAWR